VDKVLFNDIYQIFMSFCMLCVVAFCQSVLLKRDDDDDDDAYVSIVTSSEW